MNLQVSVPHQKCVYSCACCVARGHKNQNTFENLYKTNKKVWSAKLRDAIYDGEYAGIVITGECDPTQDMAYCEDVISIIDNFDPTPTVEFTTHNQKAANTLLASYWGKKVDVVTLSVTNVREYLNAWRFPIRNAFFSPIYRMVILLTEEFEFLNVNNFNTMGFDQITFKTLQHGEDAGVNAWIDSNKMSEEGLAEIRKIVDKYNSHETCSVRLDTSCQDATNRYEIFRSDGEVYDSWEAMYPKGVEKESITAYDKQGFPIKEITFSKKEGEYAPVNLDLVKIITPICEEESPIRAPLSNSEYNQQLNNLKEEWMQKFVYKEEPAPVIIKKAEENDYE